jgi:chromosome segregation ATPase
MTRTTATQLKESAQLEAEPPTETSSSENQLEELRSLTTHAAETLHELQRLERDAPTQVANSLQPQIKKLETAVSKAQSAVEALADAGTKLQEWDTKWRETETRSHEAAAQAKAAVDAIDRELNRSDQTIEKIVRREMRATSWQMLWRVGLAGVGVGALCGSTASLLCLVILGT